MKVEQIRQIAEIMNDNELVEVEVEQQGSKVTLRKTGSGVIEQTVASAPMQAPVQMPAAQPALAPQQQVPAEESVPPGMKEVKSPMVGTFYSSPSPDADAYVQVGSVVHKGDVLCIVEAMKLMNEVKAEFGGRITEVRLENADPVEFGQVMFLVEPA
ncbi:MAG: acetyl-CoA carboxylase biotin carboxyl carrier protein [Candidatus Omnitrophica bacterium]|nr:acetyl-CoA carboxylase biotin carboxyl carrier protein [Candidatus Omnitrophota bacterium]